MYFTKGSACFLVFLMLLYMRMLVASTAYHRSWWQLQSAAIIVFSCVVCIARNWFTSNADVDDFYCYV